MLCPTANLNKSQPLLEGGTVSPSPDDDLMEAIIRSQQDELLSSSSTTVNPPTLTAAPNSTSSLDLARRKRQMVSTQPGMFYDNNLAKYLKHYIFTDEVEIPFSCLLLIDSQWLTQNSCRQLILKALVHVIN